MFLRRTRKDLDDARKERERSKKRLDQSYDITDEIKRIKDENHFADAIIAQLMQRTS